MAQNYVLRENVLTDNTLILADKGKVFKFGYIAILKEYVFNTAWADKEIVKKFKSSSSLMQYLNKHYPDLDLDFEGTHIEDFINTTAKS